LIEKEIKDALRRLKVFSKQLTTGEQTLFGDEIKRFETDSEYLKTWFSDRALQEIFFYKSIMTDYKNQDILKIIISRSTPLSKTYPPL